MGVITVLAGTNGAGKSSIGGAMIRGLGGAYFNPDDETRAILTAFPEMNPAEANGLAWEKSLENLCKAIAEGNDYAFETTLGGNTITRTLIEGADSNGATLRVWYCGLSSPELHLERVRSRVAAGGHDIPEHKVRDRYDNSRRNLLKLVPHIADLQVLDNSDEADPKAGVRPQPGKVLIVKGRRVVYPSTTAELKATPQWAKAVVAMAIKTFAAR